MRSWQDLHRLGGQMNDVVPIRLILHQNMETQLMMTFEAMGSSSIGIFEISPNHIFLFLGMQLCQKMRVFWQR